MPAKTYFQPDDLAEYASPEAVSVPDAPPSTPTGMSPWARWLMAGGQGADLASTLAMVPQRQFREANPIGLPGVLALKAAILLGLPLVAKHLPRKTANTLGALAGVGGAIPAALNARLAASKGRP